MKAKLNVISAAVLLALAATTSVMAESGGLGLARMGPVNAAPNVGNFPAWYQDKTGITLEFCSLTNPEEFLNGWCVLAPPDGFFPESMPTADNPEGQFFDEHFYYMAENGLTDPTLQFPNFSARLIMAVEAAFMNGPAVDGDQTVFARHRLDIRDLPMNGDYRVITPFYETMFRGQLAGDRIFETYDIGAMMGFDALLGSDKIGPFLLPARVAANGQRFEVPPWPDVRTVDDPFYAALVAQGAATSPPNTGKKYLADPARIGPVTGSQMADFDAFERDVTFPLAKKPIGKKNHNTFRIEVYDSATGELKFTMDGENNFVVMGRLASQSLPAPVIGSRATYRVQDGKTTLDTFARAAQSAQPRLPGQQQAVVKPNLQVYPEACGGATDAAGLLVSPLPASFTKPTRTSAHKMLNSGDNYWGQLDITSLPLPGYVCIEDLAASNAAGQVAPSYTLAKLTDRVRIGTASYNGITGELTVSATSGDPTARLSLSLPGAPAGQALEGVGTLNVVVKTVAPPERVTVNSSPMSGAATRSVDTDLGEAPPTGSNLTVGAGSGRVNEDCSALPASRCSPTGGYSADLLATAMISVDGAAPVSLRSAMPGSVSSVTVDVTQLPRLGVLWYTAGGTRVNVTSAGPVATPDGRLMYAPNPNAVGNDLFTYTVTATMAGTAVQATSPQATYNMTITEVNDPPTVTNTTVAVNAVKGLPTTVNLLSLSAANDVDGNLLNAVIESWSAAATTTLGVKPTPTAGSITFTPLLATAAGSPASFTFRAIDARAARSALAVRVNVNVSDPASEVITPARARYIADRTRWQIDGTDNLNVNQTLTIGYADGIVAGSGVDCSLFQTNLANLPDACKIGTSPVAAGAWALDAVATSPNQDPTSTFWSTRPNRLVIYSNLKTPPTSGTIAIELR